MAINQVHKYVWLVDTIQKADKITFEDINRKWLMEDMSEGESIPKRTFHKWRDAVEDMFGIVIRNENAGKYRYYIENKDYLRRNTNYSWMISTISTSNLMFSNMSMQDRILVEDVPSGMYYLQSIITAMKESKQITFTYHNYWRNDYRQHSVEPYCVKLSHQRWYMVGRIADKDWVIVYALDRMSELSITDKAFKYPEDFSPKMYFDECFGVITGDGSKPQHIRIKATAGQANYLRALPWHHSQREVERNDESSIFELWMRPTYDFEQEILMLGENVEVLQPDTLRQKIAERIDKMRALYN